MLQKGSRKYDIIWDQICCNFWLSCTMWDSKDLANPQNNTCVGMFSTGQCELLNYLLKGYIYRQKYFLLVFSMAITRFWYKICYIFGASIISNIILWVLKHFEHQPETSTGRSLGNRIDEKSFLQWIFSDNCNVSLRFQS